MPWKYDCASFLLYAGPLTLADLVLSSKCILLANYCKSILLLFQCRLKHETDQLFGNSGRNELKINLQKDISRPIQGCRIDWCVFRLDFITGNGHKTDVLALKSCFNAITIGNQKEQIVQINSASPLCLEHISLRCT